MQHQFSGRRLARQLAGAIVLVVGLGALAFAGVPHTFADGEVLQASTLNDNFSALEKRIAALEQHVDPPGTIIAYAGAVGGNAALPAGWLLCDGSAVARTKYADLFAAVGTSWGSGDGTATFNLPDLRGVFLRGADPQALRDTEAAARKAILPGGNTGATIGTFQDDLVRTHDHAVSDPGHRHSAASGHFIAWDCTARTDLGFAPGGMYATKDGCASSASGLIAMDSTTSSATGIKQTQATGGAESRPKNAAVNYLIRF